MNMSAFLVISTTEKLNWIVDGIIECRPQNPNVSTYIGTGKLENREDGVYYIHNYSAKDGVNNDEEKATDLQELIANQFAHFRKESGVKDNLQIFILDNPIDQESLAYSQKIFDVIDNYVISQHFENNCSLTRILFSYDVSQSCNVCSQVIPEILRPIIQTAADKERIHICYIDNQDRNGAAMALSQEAHNLMLPRMLCDFMMLMSSSNSQYNIRNAVHNDTRIFSLGYAEYMYYFPDVKRYFEYAYQHDIRRYMLAHAKPDIDSLDYDKYPIGIEERVERLNPIYLDVPFDEKITDYPQSIDKQIDDIIVALHDSIVSIKEQAMEDAKKKDAETTAKRRKEMLENGEADEKNVEVTTEQDKVEKKYPNYIDRNSIYNLCLVEKMPDDQFDDNETCVNARKEYLRLIEFVQDREFKQFVFQVNSVNKSVADTDSLQSQEERKGCNIFARWFKKEQPQETATPAPIEQDSTDTTVKSPLEQIISISNLLKQKKQYQSLKAFEESLQKEVEQQAKNMNDFCLTSHCASYGSLIDVEKLKEYQSQISAVHIDAIIKQWQSLDAKERNLSALYDETKAECKRELEEFTYIHWDSPALFVKKDLDIKYVCSELKEKSIPWVNSLVIRAEQENNTTFTFYTDNEQWHQAANDKQVELPYGTTMEKSTHISSKIAIFQILQWDEHIIEGLTDAHTIEVSNDSPTEEEITSVVPPQEIDNVIAQPADAHTKENAAFSVVSGIDNAVPQSIDAHTKEKASSGVPPQGILGKAVPYDAPTKKKATFLSKLYDTAGKFLKLE